MFACLPTRRFLPRDLSVFLFICLSVCPSVSRSLSVCPLKKMTDLMYAIIHAPKGSVCMSVCLLNEMIDLV